MNLVPLDAPSIVHRSAATRMNSRAPVALSGVWAHATLASNNAAIATMPRFTLLCVPSRVYICMRLYKETRGDIRYECNGFTPPHNLMPET